MQNRKYRGEINYFAYREEVSLEADFENLVSRKFSKKMVSVRT